MHRVVTVSAGIVALPVAVLLFVGGEKPAWPQTAERSVAPLSAEQLSRNSRVVLITLDGARWQDVVDADGTVAALWERPLMPLTYALLKKNGVALPMMTSSTVTLSMPGYHALLSGRQTECNDNDCGQLSHETISDRLQALHLPRERVATFASWAPLGAAVSGLEQPQVLIDTEPSPTEHTRPPWTHARWDRDTFQRAFAHWQKERPRFLHVGLLETDETAHARDLAGLKASYRLADDVIAAFANAVAQLPDEERKATTILVTADHGRDGKRWDSHTETTDSRALFLLAFGDLVHGGTAQATQADVRPTIERLFGLCPSGGSGHALAPVVGNLPCVN